MVNARAGARRRGAALGRSATLLALLALAASCTSPVPSAPLPGAAAPEPAEEPRYASYDCGAAGSLTVENFRTSVLLVPPDGPSAELPAVPAGQSRRFRAGDTALALDSGEAVLLREGRAPLRCRR